MKLRALPAADSSELRALNALLQQKQEELREGKAAQLEKEYFHEFASTFTQWRDPAYEFYDKKHFKYFDADASQ